MKKLFGTLIVVGVFLGATPTTAEEPPLSPDEIRETIIGYAFHFWKRQASSRVYILFREDGMVEVASRRDAGRMRYRHWGESPYNIKEDEGGGLLCRRIIRKVRCQQLLLGLLPNTVIFRDASGDTTTTERIPGNDFPRF